MTADLRHIDMRPFVLVGRRDAPEWPPDTFGFYGTGVCVDPLGIIATAEHVVTDLFKRFSLPDTLDLMRRRSEELRSVGKSSTRTPVERWERPAFLFPWDPASERGPGAGTAGSGQHGVHVEPYDVAVWAMFDEIARLHFPIPHIRLSGRVAPERGELVVYGGWHLENGARLSLLDPPASRPFWTWRTGKVVGYGQTGFFVEGESFPGMSGGPVLEPETGDLIGIVRGNLRSATGEPHGASGGGFVAADMSFVDAVGIGLADVRKHLRQFASAGEYEYPPECRS